MVQNVRSLQEVVFHRRSIRLYRPEPVSREQMMALLDAGAWAPSAHNRQPWRFAVIESEAQKEALAGAMGAQLRQDLRADGVPEAVIEADVSRSCTRIMSAPTLIILCLSMADMDQYPDERRSRNEYLMAVQSAAMAGQNLMLAAYDAGLGTCWMCAPLFAPQVVREVLGLPEDWQPQALITLGYPAETREKTRRPIEEMVLWR